MFDLYHWVMDATPWKPSDHCAANGESWPALDKWHYVMSHVWIAWQYRLIPFIFLALVWIYAKERLRKDGWLIAFLVACAGFVFFCGEGHALQSNTFNYPAYLARS